MSQKIYWEGRPWSFRKTLAVLLFNCCSGSGEVISGATNLEIAVQRYSRIGFAIFSSSPSLKLDMVLSILLMKLGDTMSRIC